MINKFKNTKIYMRRFTDHLITLLKFEIQRARVRTYDTTSTNMPINTTGSLANSIRRLRVKNTDNGFSYGIEMNAYADKLNINQGQARRQPSIRSIVSWIQAKNITIVDSNKRVISLSDLPKVKGVAYAIARKIGRKNVKPTGFINSAIERAMDKLSGVEDAILEDISMDLDYILEKAGYISKGEKYTLKDGD